MCDEPKKPPARVRNYSYILPNGGLASRFLIAENFSPASGRQQSPSARGDVWLT